MLSIARALAGRALGFAAANWLRIAIAGALAGGVYLAARHISGRLVELGVAQVEARLATARAAALESELARQAAELARREHARRRAEAAARRYRRSAERFRAALAELERSDAEVAQWAAGHCPWPAAVRERVCRYLAETRAGMPDAARPAFCQPSGGAGAEPSG